MILELITQFVIGSITLSVIIGLGIVIYSICRKVYDECGGFVLVGFIIVIPISILIGKLILPYLL